MAWSFHGGTFIINEPSSLFEILTDTGTHFHIAPSELNTPTPNNGSISFLIVSPSNDLLKQPHREMGVPVRTFLIAIKVCRKDELFSPRQQRRGKLVRSHGL